MTKPLIPPSKSSLGYHYLGICGADRILIKRFLWDWKNQQWISALNNEFSPSAMTQNGWEYVCPTNMLEPEEL